MRHLKKIALLAGCLCLAACDRHAVDFAKQTRLMLAGYQKQLETQIADAEDHYLTYATLQADSAFTRLSYDLAAARAETGDKLAFDYTDKTKQPSRIRDELSAYASQEHQADLTAHQGAVDRSRAYLEKIEELRADKDKIEAFGKLLDALSSNRPLQQGAEEIGKFVQATKDDFDNLVCADWEKKIADPKTDATQKATLEQLFGQRKCKKSS